MVIPNQARSDRQVAMWLLVCAAAIFSMIILGGVTRLTSSGLSIVEWKPITGIVPPLNELQWQEQFEQYKQYPEYRKTNLGMSLDSFKRIFLFEYAHRLLGRLIGVIFLLPFLYFYFRQQIKPGLTPKLLLMFVLGGLQGALGWYMVKSGLVNDPHVSQYRLTAHLAAAGIIYAYILWVAFGMLIYHPGGNLRARSLGRYGVVLCALVFLMILSGGFVAGTKAGHAYSTFPLMAGSLFPPGLYSTNPAWLAMFEDITTIQFNHRMFAYVLIVFISLFSWRVWCSAVAGAPRTGALVMLCALVLQVGLGISTLLLHVPVALAASHQAGAIVLLTSVLFTTVVLRQQGSASR